MSGEEKVPQSPMWDYLNQEYAVRLPRRGEIVQAEVVRIDQEGVVVDIGAKREGLVPQEDLAKLDPNFLSQIQVGTRLPAYVLQPEGPEGNVILSINLARVEEEWQEAERHFKDGEIYEGKVAGYNKGGLIVPFGQIRGFVPASQILNLGDDKTEPRPQRLGSLVGETLELKVIEVDRSRQRLILSQRAAQREARDRRKERLIADLKEGEIRRGRVSGLSQFGAFVDLGGADGLIHISELSYKRLAHPRELLQVGQEVEVYVLKVDRERKRIGLSLRRLQPDPWRQIEDRFQVGQIVEGRITKVANFGAFAALEDGIEGLIHSSEIGEGNAVQEGDIIPLKIISIDPSHRRIGLSLKRAPAREGADAQPLPEPLRESLAPPTENAAGEALSIPSPEISEEAAVTFPPAVEEGVLLLAPPDAGHKQESEVKEALPAESTIPDEEQLETAKAGEQALFIANPKLEAEEKTSRKRPTKRKAATTKKPPAKRSKKAAAK